MSGSVTMYSTTWCGYCQRLKSQLDRAGIGYTEINIEEDPKSAAYVESVNGGNQVVPTVLVTPAGRRRAGRHDQPEPASGPGRAGRLSTAPAAAPGLRPAVASAGYGTGRAASSPSPYTRRQRSAE